MGPNVRETRDFCHIALAFCCNKAAIILLVFPPGSVLRLGQGEDDARQGRRWTRSLRDTFARSSVSENYDLV